MLCEVLSKACVPSMYFYVMEDCGSCRGEVASVRFEFLRRGMKHAVEDMVSSDWRSRVCQWYMMTT